MNPFKAVALVVFWCLCPPEKYFSMGYEAVISRDPDEPEDYCLLSTVEDNAATMPIPFRKINNKLDILYPDLEEKLQFRRGEKFKLLCAGTRFLHVNLVERTELEVTCAGDNKLLYGGKLYDYQQLECEFMPKSSVVVTDQKCHTANHNVVKVGFQSNSGLIELYNVCFDSDTQSTLYTWYDTRNPFEEINQEFNQSLTFFAPEELYDENSLFMDEMYNIEGQKKALAATLGSKDQAEKFIKNDEENCLSIGQFVASDDFYYLFEQAASCNYMNAAPQWQIFDDGKWADLEESIRDILTRDDRQFTVVTGSYGTCKLPDMDGVLRPLFLDPPFKIRVPMFYWKMLYDKRLRDGIVFLLMNNPYSEVDESTYVCKNICPKGYKSEAFPQAFTERKVYCCTVESFEQVFGRLDIVTSSK